MTMDKKTAFPWQCRWKRTLLAKQQKDISLQSCGCAIKATITALGEPSQRDSAKNISTIQLCQTMITSINDENAAAWGNTFVPY